MTYRPWHPLAVTLAAVALRQIVPAPWGQLAVDLATLGLVLVAGLMVRWARQQLREADRLRGEALDLIARVHAAAHAEQAARTIPPYVTRH